ncbi:MAG TPA: iron-sulfur cluster repair protein YtfE [Planctomycetota bacterium]|nr:iron-sulfur cluster repair protein YtfE [Planctomycetota bacterium]
MMTRLTCGVARKRIVARHVGCSAPAMNHTATIHPSDSLAQLATARAGASRVFHRHNLDFCCHGQISLADACRKKGLDVDTLIHQIEAEQRIAEPVEPWTERPIAELVEHIVAHFHEPHRRELPRLQSMAERVEKVHGDKASCPRGLAALIAGLAADLVLHMQKEERILFPMIVRGEGADAAGPIQVMEQEHVDASAVLAAIRDLTTDYQPPPEACGTWKALYLGLDEFERDLMQHVHLENHVLFPRALHS